LSKSLQFRIRFIYKIFTIILKIKESVKDDLNIYKFGMHMFTGQMPFTQYNINEKIGRESENVLKSQLTENFIFYLCLKKVSFRWLHEMRKRL